MLEGFFKFETEPFQKIKGCRIDSTVLTQKSCKTETIFQDCGIWFSALNNYVTYKKENVIF